MVSGAENVLFYKYLINAFEEKKNIFILRSKKKKNSNKIGINELMLVKFLGYI